MPRAVVTLDESTGWVNIGSTLAEIATKLLEDEIVDFVAGQEGAVSHKAILDEVEGRRVRKVRALRFLPEQGRLNRLGAGTKADPMFYSVPHSHL